MNGNIWDGFGWSAWGRGIIRVVPQERHRVSIHQQLHCLFNNLLGLQQRKHYRNPF